MGRWEGIYEFVQVVDSGGFSAAARRMGVSNSQISKRVAALEDRLGTRLLNRTTRRLTLTDEGEMFYHRCRDTIDAFESAEHDVASHQHEPRGVLKLNVADSLPARFLMPLVSEFLDAYPRISLSVDFTNQRVDLVSLGYDLAIWQGELKDSSLIARKLTDNHYCLVASPGYLSLRGEPATPADLEAHQCLGGESLWPLSVDNHLREIKVRCNLASNSPEALLGAALTGLGIARLPFFTVREALERGELREVLADASPLSERVWAVYPQSKHVAARVRLFIGFLLERLQPASP